MEIGRVFFYAVMAGPADSYAPARMGRFMVSFGDICVCFISGIRQLFIKIQIRVIIRIAKAQIFALCDCNAFVPRCGHSAVLLMDDGYSFVFLCPGVGDFAAVVCAAVVNQDNFDFGQRLVDKRIQALFYVWLDIEYRNDNGYFW
jgi:hypothetical protein